LVNIFELGGFPTEQNVFLFNGDFVDRGSFSFETVFTLMLIKLSAPSALHMHRGNHETKNMNRIYGFEGEIKHKYDDQVMKLFTKFFQTLPLASVLESKVFVAHGGLSTNGSAVEGINGPPSVTLDEINALNRFGEPPESGLMSDLLWADPQPQRGRAPSKRGLGFSFGPDYTESFLKRNNLQLVIRSHEVRDEGYEEEHNGKVITVFSAPNYCDQMGNKGAYIRFTSEDMTPAFTKFVAAPHPNIPPMRYAGNMLSMF
jgi:serine/threonine-protein phosphatase 5